MGGEWRSAGLGELVDIRTGKLDSNHAVSGGAYPFFTCAQDPLRIETHAFDCDAILLAGNNANGVFHLNRYTGRFNAYQRTYVITLKEGAPADISFLFYVLKTLTQRLAVYSQGTATKFLTMKILDPLPVPVPPLDEQRAIAHILGTLDDKIELNRRTNETLEAMARALFKSWFVDFDPVRAKAQGQTPPGMDPVTAALFPSEFQDSELGPIPKGWCITKCGECIELAYGKSLPKAKRHPGPFPVYGSGGQDGLHAEPLVRGPGIVVGRKGTVGTVHWVNKDFYPIDTTFFVKPRLHGATLRWVFERLRAMDISHLGADSAVPGVNRHAVYAKEWVLPNPELSKAYETQIEPLLKRSDTSNQESSSLAGLRNTLLPRLLSGELSVAQAEQAVEATA